MDIIQEIMIVHTNISTVAMVSAVVYNNGASMHQYKEMQTLSVQTCEAQRPACQHRAPATSALANATWQRAGRCSGTRIISGPHLRPSPNHPAAEPHFPWWRFFVSRPITRLCVVGCAGRFLRLYAHHASRYAVLVNKYARPEVLVHKLESTSVLVHKFVISLGAQICAPGLLCTD